MTITVNIYSIKGDKKGEVDLPAGFDMPVRYDLIKRAVLAQQSHRLQPKAPNRRAGRRTSAASWGPGHGASRVTRVKGSRYSAAGRGAIAPGTVGGRRAHPPTVDRNLDEKVNKKEKKLATASALAATTLREIVEARGHKIDNVKEIPLVIEDSLEEISKAKDVKEFFEAVGVTEDIERARVRKIRVGKGKMRGRRYRRKKSLLIVVGEDKGIFRGTGNFPGVDIVLAKNVSPEDLAPGTHPGRLCIYTENAMKDIEGRFS